jgi:hypothetical protein
MINKPDCLCVLLHIIVNTTPDGVHAVGVVRRMQAHERLGEATGGITNTSTIRFIDFEKKFFETEHTIYRWI